MVLKIFLAENEIIFSLSFECEIFEEIEEERIIYNIATYYKVSAEAHHLDYTIGDLCQIFC